MNKFDYILYIECKLVFIGFWLCYILQKRKKEKKEFIKFWQQNYIYKPKKCLLIIVLPVTFH